jgi:hypothetical protein
MESKVCSNPWCKGIFNYSIDDNDDIPEICPKCQSFDNELSGGVTWKEKQYEGSRWEGPHQISYKIKKYF